ncbi:MAG: hypothetical protein IPN33_15670 [Saprospiraceae bacterium]|nr:hypothetical protein [Saprospiraceae bacterium]
MIGKVKQWLGIEGVKLELLLPEEVPEKSGFVVGKIVFQSMNAQTITGIKIVLIEKYTRGRGKDKLVDEYEVSATSINRTIEIPMNGMVEVDFQLPFKLVKSNVEQFGGRNFLFGGIAAAAKMINNVKSEYRIEAEASVKGVALNPFDKQSLVIK